ncbi:MAG TPA: hypothetical protein VJB12_00425, partial [Candidatus Nanoarchaeia archaeon]|nr:hypothetical protein [Candidatus Nanoarchaeia archaeon]
MVSIDAVIRAGDARLKAEYGIKLPLEDPKPYVDFLQRNWSAYSKHAKDVPAPDGKNSGVFVENQILALLACYAIATGKISLGVRGEKRNFSNGDDWALFHQNPTQDRPSSPSYAGDDVVPLKTLYRIIYGCSGHTMSPKPKKANRVYSQNDYRLIVQALRSGKYQDLARG